MSSDSEDKDRGDGDEEDSGTTATPSDDSDYSTSASPSPSPSPSEETTTDSDHNTTTKKKKKHKGAHEHERRHGHGHRKHKHSSNSRSHGRGHADKAGTGTGTGAGTGVTGGTGTGGVMTARNTPVLTGVNPFRAGMRVRTTKTTGSVEAGAEGVVVRGHGVDRVLVQFDHYGLRYKQVNLVTQIAAKSCRKHVRKAQSAPCTPVTPEPPRKTHGHATTTTATCTTPQACPVTPLSVEKENPTPDTHEPSGTSGYIYVMHNATKQLCHIGVSHEPSTTWKAISDESSREALLAVFHCANPTKIEADLSALLNACNITGTQNYHCTPLVAITTLSTLIFTGFEHLPVNSPLSPLSVPGRDFEPAVSTYKPAFNTELLSFTSDTTENNILNNMDPQFDFNPPELLTLPVAGDTPRSKQDNS